MKKIAFLFFILFLVLPFSVFAANIDNIKVETNRKIFITPSSDIVLRDWELDWSIKVLEDLVVLNFQKDLQNYKKITINLKNSLEKWKIYSLFGILWAEANMDFQVSEGIIWEITNPNFDDENLSIETINILDEKTIEIYYNKDLEAKEFLYKVYRKLDLVSINVINNIINIFTKEDLEWWNPYILLVNSFKDFDWNNVKMQEQFFDFKTPEYFKKQKKEENLKEKPKWNLEKIAMNSANTPNTWPATWLLLALTISLSSFYFLKNRKD